MQFSWTKQSTCQRLTWPARLFLLGLTLLFLAGCFVFVYPFLAPNHPPTKGLMVIEGWIGDEPLEQAVEIYKKGSYSKIICTGIPFEVGSYLLSFHSYAEMTAERLRHLGVSNDELIVLTAPACHRDRTWNSALMLRDYLQTHPSCTETNLHLITVGPHGRRSWLLFRQALGRSYQMGITSLPDPAYSPKRWYTCSRGVRAVTDELIAYFYARFLFHPKLETHSNES